ncbi:LOW QUALITY PROTEIN: hypothetical protein OSB04_012342 [Centaurea solstitialis]|uniref:Uncharacterized protein n=1 Tax=Centaurea solstitialis TaxID=347529 RepID=A0AA38TB79_9ASTR|nr:LOW QUALITY PROTEIN: hypothetical protein OSB04_012342 [Centaurea solstitialis]
MSLPPSCAYKCYQRSQRSNMVYVDENIVTELSPSYQTKFITPLADYVSLKCLGFFSYFLGIKVIPNTHVFFLNQIKSIHDLLYHMHDLEHVSTLVTLNYLFTLATTSPFWNHTNYDRPWQVTGTYSSNDLMLPMLLINYHNTYTTLLTIVNLLLNGYYDANWARATNNYISTTNYLVYLHCNSTYLICMKQLSLACFSSKAWSISDITAKHKTIKKYLKKLDTGYLVSEPETAVSGPVPKYKESVIDTYFALQRARWA